MSQVGLLIVKAVNGGLFVLAFALVGEVVRPKRFSGLFGAAPSVALGSLIVLGVADGQSYAVTEARGMMLGAVAMVAACMVAVPAVRRWRAVRGSGALWATWLAAAVAGYLAVFR